MRWWRSAASWSWSRQGGDKVTGKVMVVGVLKFQVSIFEARSLKDKRRVIKSLKDRIGNKYNVSIAEVGYNDVIRTSILAVATVANEKRFVESSLSVIVDFVRQIPQLTLVDYSMETF